MFLAFLKLLSMRMIFALTTLPKVETFFNSNDVKIEAFDLSANMIFAATQSQQVIVLDALSESVRIVFISFFISFFTKTSHLKVST